MFNIAFSSGDLKAKSHEVFKALNWTFKGDGIKLEGVFIVGMFGVVVSKDGVKWGGRVGQTLRIS